MADFQPLNLAQLYQGADAAVASAMQTNLMTLQASKMKQEFDVEDQLRSLARRSTTVDEAGNSGFNEQNFLSGARAIDPLKAMAFEKAGIEAKKAALDITKTQVETANIQDQMDERRFKQAGERLKFMNEASTVPYMKYKELIDKGVPDAEARQQVQPLHEQAIQSLVNSNMFTKDQLAKFKLNPQFDPTAAEAGMRQVLGAKEGLAQYWEERKFGETKRHNVATEGQASAALGETHRHNVAEEGTPETIESAAQSIAKYDQAPLEGRSLTSPAGMKIMERVNQINPKYNAMNYETAKKTQEAFAVGAEGKSMKSISTSIDHMQTLRELGEALNNGNTQMFNQVAQAWAKRTGKAAPTNFEAAKNIIGGEIVKGIVGAGGGEGDREKAQGALDAVGSPSQIGGALDTVTDLLGGQLKGLEQQYKAGTNGRSDFREKYLTPEAQKAFEAHGGGGKSGGASFDVPAPDGKTYSFPNQKAADEFKKRAGIK